MFASTIHDKKNTDEIFGCLTWNGALINSEYK